MQFPGPTLCILAALWFPVMALAQGPGGHPEKQLEEVLRTVQLNPEQKAKVRQIRESSRNRIHAMRDELDKCRRELNQQLDSNAEDEAVRQAFQKLQNAKMAMEKARFDRMLAIRAVLSDGQKSSFLNLRQKSRAAHRGPGPSETRRE